MTNTTHIPLSEAKAKLSQIVRDSDSHDVMLMRHGRPAAVVMSYDRFEALLERMEDMADRLSVLDREGMVMDYEKLSAELGFAD
jgi:antitoxin StbD